MTKTKSATKKALSLLLALLMLCSGLAISVSAATEGDEFAPYQDGEYNKIIVPKSFKKAGVKSIVMSLWKVNDEATSLMMSCFYRHLTNGKERHEALELARKDVVKEYPDTFYWAGFIMLD